MSMSATIALVQITEVTILSLIDALHDATDSNRGPAASALGHIGGLAQNIVPALIDALGDIDEAVAQHATCALSRIGTPAVPALIRGLKDENQEVRFYAAIALADFNQPAVEAVDALIDALCDETCGVRWVAVEALQSIGTPEALQAINTYELHESERYHPKCKSGP